MVNDKNPIILFGSKAKKNWYQIATPAYDWSREVGKQIEEIGQDDEESDSDDDTDVNEEDDDIEEEEKMEVDNNHNKNKNTNNPVQSRKRKRRNLDDGTAPKKKRKISASKNIVNADYNQNMGGVDLHNQVSQTYTSNRRVKKWTTHIFMAILDSIVANGLAIYNKTTALKINPQDEHGKTYGVLTKKKYILAIRNELLKPLAQTVIQNERVRKQDHQKRIAKGTLSKEESKVKLKNKTGSKDIKYCSNPKAQNGQYKRRK